jgi:hypothetical protein
MSSSTTRSGTSYGLRSDSRSDSRPDSRTVYSSNSSNSELSVLKDIIYSLDYEVRVLNEKVHSLENETWNLGNWCGNMQAMIENLFASKHNTQKDNSCSKVGVVILMFCLFKILFILIKKYSK